MVKESDRSLAASVLNFGLDETGRKLAGLCVEEIDFFFEPNSWTANGPGILNRVIKNICGADKVI